MTKNTEEQLKKEFKEFIVSDAFYFDGEVKKEGMLRLPSYDDITNFWLSKLSSLRKEDLEACRNKYENCPQCTGLKNEALQSLVEEIEGLKYEQPLLGTPENTARIMLAVNSTLSHASSLIKSRISK